MLYVNFRSRLARAMQLYAYTDTVDNNTNCENNNNKNNDSDDNDYDSDNNDNDKMLIEWLSCYSLIFVSISDSSNGFPEIP